MMQYVFFVFGLFIGSFLNVLIDRLPRGEGVLIGRSYCESCKKQLKWYDLIPVFSFLILKRKCRNCKSLISFYYPTVEFITGVLFAAVYLKSNFKFSIFNFQSNPNFQFLNLSFIINPSFISQLSFLIFHLVIVSSLIVIFFTDLKYGIIPNKVLYPAILISFISTIINHQSSIINLFLSAVGAFSFFLSLFLITKGKGMGFGDVKLVFLLGLILGFPWIIASLYLAFLTGAILSLILILWKKKSLKDRIPFGPFLVFAALVVFFFQDFISKLLPPGIFF